MAKEIVCLFGSPRLKGNSRQIAQHFNETAEKLGAKIKTFFLNNLKYQGCQACMTCKTTLEHCVLEDDLIEVLDSIRETDILVIATPVYYGEVSSQVKTFIDRTFSYLVPDYPTNPNPCRLKPGKILVFIQTQGHPDQKKYADVFARYKSFFKLYGFKESHLIRACGVMGIDDIQAHEDIMKLTEEIAEKVMD